MSFRLQTTMILIKNDYETPLNEVRSFDFIDMIWKYVEQKVLHNVIHNGNMVTSECAKYLHEVFVLRISSHFSQKSELTQLID